VVLVDTPEHAVAFTSSLCVKMNFFASRAISQFVARHGLACSA